MSKSIKLNDNIVIDEQSINCNFGKMIYRNTTSNSQGRWTYSLIKNSDYLTVGNKIRYENNCLIVSNCKYIKINVKVSFTDNSYNHQNDIVINVNSKFYELKNKTNGMDYIVNSLIVPIDGTAKIYLAKYTDNDNNLLITTDQDNYMTVEIIT